MISLGIESTAHTFGVGIVNDKGKFLANIKDSYTTESGGMIPNDASEHHIQVCDKVIKDALKTAKLKIKDIDLITFSQGPGIGHTLRIGAMAARSLHHLHNIPIVGVNHCIAHLEIGRILFKCKDPVLLYASGANTQIIAYEGKKYRIFGETLDIGSGNFIDSFARDLGLGFPGGPKIQELAKKSKNYIELPYVVKGMDVSFGGILTNLKTKINTKKYKEEDLAYSAQETIFAMLLEVTERAMAHCNKTELLLGGGVACNTRLQEMANIMCKERGAKCYTPANEYLVDNGAMIAWLGILKYKKQNKKSDTDLLIRPYERTDDIDIIWRK
jgi:N6-L-threonylcarbamoyladenine synthase